jgi:hypothetical protein
VTGEQIALWIGIGAAVIGGIMQALYIMRRFTQSEERVQQSISKQTSEIQLLKTQTSNDLKNLGESTSASLQRLETATTEKIDHHNAIAAMRFDELGRRVGTVERTLDRITKVVVFDGGRETP